MKKFYNKIRSKYGLSVFCYSLFLSTLLSMGLASCKGGQESMTRRLFMQSKRANLELPADMVDESGQAVLNEDVSYSHEDNTSVTIAEQDSIEKARKRSINEVQRLGEVTITAKVKQKFAPERDGKVSVDFIVKVPKELLSADWRVKLQPELLHNDSIVKLRELILKGENFSAKQQADSINYFDYLNSIIPQSAYDSLFLDREGIARDLRKRQEYYWGLYNKQYKHIMNYFEWKHDINERYAYFNSKMEGNRLNLYHSYKRKQLEESIERLTTGIDTTGIDLKYTNKFNKRAKLLPQYHLKRELTLNKVPKKYKAFFLNEPDPENIINHSTTEKDSIEIAEHRYFFDRIAENELKETTKDEVKKRMIPFPMETAFLLDSVVTTSEDFVYYYKKEYPVTAGLAKLRITMKGQVTATDQSIYSLPKADTLHYVISSLVQLADTSLIIRETKLYRNMYDQMTIYPQFEPNKSQFNISYNNNGYVNRQEIDSLMSHYRKVSSDMGFQMDSMQIYSRGSLDGNYDTNYELSQKRAESLAEYLQSNYNIAYNSIKVIPKGEDWQGFVDELKQRDDIENKEAILEKVSQTVYPDKTEQEIRWQYKKDYKIIRNEIYPKLRKMDIVFNVSRPGMVASDSIKREVKVGYEEGLRLLMNREYWEAIEILKDYPDYNTALCLACMGYNGKAYDLLVQLKETANIKYLLAIVSQRMGREEEAVSHLLKAIELDPNKAYRINQDSEVIQLVAKYNLQSQIDSLQDRFDLPQEDEQKAESTETEEAVEESEETKQTETVEEQATEGTEATTKAGEEATANEEEAQESQSEENKEENENQ